MSTRERTTADHDDRQLRPREERAGLDRWLYDLYFHGFGQTTFLGLLMLWTVLQTPFLGLEAKTAVVGAWPGAMLAIGTLRSEVVGVGRPWPALTNRKLGVRGGYGAWASRAVYVSATLGLGTYGGVAVAVVTGDVLLAVPVAAVLAVAGVVALPYLHGGSGHARAGRAAYYCLGLGLAFAYSSPLTLSVGDPYVLSYFALLAVGAVYDLRA